MFFPGVYLLVLVALVVVVIAWWRVFEKAGQPGWAAIVPFYNFYVALRVVGRPGYWLALMFVPVANLVVVIIVASDMAKAFGRDAGFAVLLIVLPFVGYPMLAFSAATYLGPVADPRYRYAMYAQYAAYYQQAGYPRPYPPAGYPPPAYSYPPQPPAYPAQPPYPRRH